MGAADKGVVRGAWKKLRRIKWHQWARIIAIALLADQLVGTVSALPGSEAIVLACIGALFAPIPVERQR